MQTPLGTYLFSLVLLASLAIQGGVIASSRLVHIWGLFGWGDELPSALPSRSGVATIRMRFSPGMRSADTSQASAGTTNTATPQVKPAAEHSTLALTLAFLKPKVDKQEPAEPQLWQRLIPKLTLPQLSLPDFFKPQDVKPEQRMAAVVPQPAPPASSPQQGNVETKAKLAAGSESIPKRPWSRFESAPGPGLKLAPQPPKKAADKALPKSDGKPPDPKVPLTAPVGHDNMLPSRGSRGSAGVVTELPSTTGIVNPPPPYPPEAQAAGLEGRVRLRLKIDATGRVTDVGIEESSGVESLDQSAIRTVWHWRFNPGRRGGAPVTTEVVQSFRFVISRR